MCLYYELYRIQSPLKRNDFKDLQIYCFLSHIEVQLIVPNLVGACVWVEGSVNLAHTRE